MAKCVTVDGKENIMTRRCGCHGKNDNWIATHLPCINSIYCDVSDHEWSAHFI